MSAPKERVEEVVTMANGESVPASLVKALDDFDKVWPGATFPTARAAIVDVILKAQESSA